MRYNSPTELLLALINTEKKHDYYQRVVKLADDYMAIISGVGTERFLMQFVQRETVEQFEQRVRLTQAITPAVASSIMKPFQKVSRNDKIKKRFDFKIEDLNKRIQKMMDGFYGGSMGTSFGVEYWLKQRLPELDFADPNAWVVVEWEEENGIMMPYPYEVSSREAINFEYQAGKLQWLLTKQEWEFESVQGDGSIAVVEGMKYTLYHKDVTLVVREVDLKALEKNGYELQENEQLIKAGNKDVILATFNSNLGYVHAFRCGHVRDIYTGGLTFVNPFHEAMCYFMKSIKTVSELDLTMTLHAHPQKLQYVQRCEGTGEKGCQNGYIPATVQKCPACNGYGFKHIGTSAQDAITLPMPEDGAENPVKLEDIVHYKTPPVELIRFQKEYVAELKTEAHMAVFNSTVFIQGGSSIAKTATEVDINMQGVYDALEPFTELYSMVYKFYVFHFAKLAGVKNAEEGEIVHIFPADLKLKTLGMLLQELTAANTSGAPSFLRDKLNEEIAELLFAGDAVERRKYDVKHTFFPFNGLSPAEITTQLANSFTSRFTKVLYSNFDAIFADILIEHPDFLTMDSHGKQWNILQEKTREFMLEIDKENPLPQITFGQELNRETEEIEEEEVDEENNPNGEEQEDEEQVA